MTTALSILKLLVFSLVISGTSAAIASDWNYAGASTIGKVEAHQFFDAESLSRPSANTVRVWVMQLRRSSLDAYLESHRASVLDKSGKKLVAGYAPQFFNLAPVKAKFSQSEVDNWKAAFTSFEIIANAQGIQPFSKFYFDIDCKGRRIKILDGYLYADSGDVESKVGSDLPFQFIAPDTTAQWISWLLCKQKPEK